MSFEGVDPAVARQGSRALGGVSDDLDAIVSKIDQAAWKGNLAPLFGPMRGLAVEMSEETDSTSRLLALLADRIEAADSSYEATLLDRAIGAHWTSLHRSLFDSRGISVDRLLERTPPEACPVPGDPGGTDGMEQRSPWVIGGSHPEEWGRNTVLRALADTANGHQIRVDEFEIVQVNDGRYVVVLPGVVDLSAAADDPFAMFDWDEQHRSVRATWMAARRSMLSSDVDDNLYAEMVRDVMLAQVPAGSSVMIVGHSFGADTALDLAADETLRRRQIEITHVVAAAYHSGPQLSSVPESTEVLVVQNSKDRVISGEIMLESPNQAVHGAVDSYHAAMDLDLEAAEEHAGSAAAGVGKSILGGGRWLGERGDDLASAVADDVVDHYVGVDVPLDDDSIMDTFDLEVGVSRPNDAHVAVVFEGGEEHAGHHQDHYSAYVTNTSEPGVVDFFTSVGAAGYANPGESFAVDVSVPEGE